MVSDIFLDTAQLNPPWKAVTSREFNIGEPIAYFFTWTTYGTWLPGDERGWNRKGEPDAQPMAIVLRVFSGGKVAKKPDPPSLAAAGLSKNL